MSIINPDIFPTVCIRKVTFLTLGHTPIRRDDPHIHDDTTVVNEQKTILDIDFQKHLKLNLPSDPLGVVGNKKQYVPYGEKKLSQIKNSIDNFSDTAPNFLRVEVDVCIKEALAQDSLLSQFFDYDLIKKYMKIRVILSSDSSITKSLLARQEGIQNQKIIELEQIGKLFFQDLTLSDVKPLPNGVLGRNVFNRTGNVNGALDLLKNNNANAGGSFLESEPIDLLFTARFTIPTVEPNHLATMALL